MAEYSVRIRQTAIDDLKVIRRYYQKEILDTIESLLPAQAERVSKTRIKKLGGFRSLYRLRVRDHRVFYRVEGSRVQVLRVLSKQQERAFYEEADSYEHDSGQ